MLKNQIYLKFFCDFVEKIPSLLCEGENLANLVRPRKYIKIGGKYHEKEQIIVLYYMFCDFNHNGFIAFYFSPLHWISLLKADKSGTAGYPDVPCIIAVLCIVLATEVIALFIYGSKIAQAIMEPFGQFVFPLKIYFVHCMLFKKTAHYIIKISNAWLQFR